MATSFSRSLRSVEGDGGRLARWLVSPVLTAIQQSEVIRAILTAVRILGGLHHEYRRAA